MTVDDPLSVLAAIPARAWLVGGALRDRLLQRATADYDVAVEGDPASVARELGRAAGGHAFLLSEGFGGWRVVARGHQWQLDLVPVAQGGIEADLAARDFTVNAMAAPVGAPSEVIDPFGGLADLEARRLRMVSEPVFELDPLRALRLARLKCQLGFGIDPGTRAAARRTAPEIAGVAAERIFHELKRIVCAERALDGLAELDAVGATEVVLPELAALQGIAQSPYHHLDVYQHTQTVLAETVALERDPEPAFAEHAGAVRAFLAEPLADELTRGQALRFGALFHDIAKPATRAIASDGRVTFMGHDVAGEALAGQVLRRLRASGHLRQHVAALTRHHLALGFLVRRMPLQRREIYRYMRDCEPVQADVTILSVADRLATRGQAVGEDAIERHLGLARELIGEAFRWRAAPPRSPLRGDELARRLQIGPGPELGHLLEQLTEASFVGEASSREEALELATRLCCGGSQ